MAPATDTTPHSSSGYEFRDPTPPEVPLDVARRLVQASRKRSVSPSRSPGAKPRKRARRILGDAGSCQDEAPAIRVPSTGNPVTTPPTHLAGATSAVKPVNGSRVFKEKNKKHTQPQRQRTARRSTATQKTKSPVPSLPSIKNLESCTQLYGGKTNWR
ncbi:hypothetical protein PR002_g23019 [Phytophthora rubi]|uniref:Uncharacterized protein n=1 Tax=Phytophthora rubi TaxID=129364 RepID=A0A6A3IVZ3_9STRA|nr:hypothetical protein PR002_g23019 [Phytophthora rubi]